jgi:ComF family protein
MKHVRSLWDRFAGLLLPRQCPLCRTVVDSAGVCFACWETLHFITDPLCDRCGVPLPFETGQGSVCGACFVKEFPLKRLRSLWVYDDASRTLVLRFKTSGQRWLGPVLGQALARLVYPFRKHIDWIVPVPLHRYRLWRRGFNQSAVLAQSVSHETGLPYVPLCLKRHRHTPSMGALRAKERLLNVKDAFCVTGSYAADLKGKRVLLVDDVYTTGATLNACAHILKQGGAASVSGITLARTVKPEDITLRYGARKRASAN